MLAQAVQQGIDSLSMARKKNPAAVSLGRLGGKKSAIARMKKIPAKKRSEIAKKAALARWGKKQLHSALHTKPRLHK